MSLHQELQEFAADFVAKVPADVRDLMVDATNKLAASGIEDRVIKVGDKIADITLKNSKGEDIRLSDKLSQGPVVLVFYRGGWCPYCNLELRAYQRELENIKALGATLIAVSPELPDNSLTTAEKNELTFEVLSDVGLKLSDALGLTFDLSESLVPIYNSFGIDLPAAHGEAAWRLPLPGSFVIDRDGTVKLASAQADYTQRMEPSEALAALRELG